MPATRDFDRPEADVAHPSAVAAAGGAARHPPGRALEGPPEGRRRPLPAASRAGRGAHDR